MRKLNDEPMPPMTRLNVRPLQLALSGVCIGVIACMAMLGLTIYRLMHVAAEIVASSVP